MTIQIGDTLNLQKGSMIYVGDGKVDAYVTGPDGRNVLKQAGITLTDKQIEAWQQLKAKQATSTRTSATL